MKNKPKQNKNHTHAQTKHQKIKPVLDVHIIFVSRGIKQFTLKEALGSKSCNKVLMGNEGEDQGAKVFSDIWFCVTLSNT